MEEVKIDLDTIPTRAAIWIDIFMLTGIRKGVSINYCILSLGGTMHTLATSALLLFTAM